jgi:hypothetical protein
MVVVPGMPIVGAVDVPMVELPLVGIPIVGIVGVPIAGMVVPIVGSVEAPVPNVGERAFVPGVKVVCDESVGELVTRDADIGGPKFVKLDGSNNTDCAQTAQGAAASTAGTSHFTILFISPPCVVSLCLFLLLS